MAIKNRIAFKDNCKVPVKKKCYTGQVGERSVGHKQETNEQDKSWRDL